MADTLETCSFHSTEETRFNNCVLFGTDALLGDPLAFGGSDDDDDEYDNEDDASCHFYEDDRSTGLSVYEDADMEQPDDHEHVLVNAFEGVKQAWAWGKHLGLVGTVMEVVEGVASNVAKTALGADLHELEERLVQPRLQAADDSLAPAYQAVSSWVMARTAPVWETFFSRLLWKRITYTQNDTVNVTQESSLSVSSTPRRHSWAEDEEELAEGEEWEPIVTDSPIVEPMSAYIRLSQLVPAS
jgi:hypothetical protein